MVKIEKRLSDKRLARYILDIEEKDLENICSIEICIGSERERAYDVCRDMFRARDFLQMLADGEGEPCHLKDIVCDNLPL
jgi:hypothetical protein